MTEPVEVIVNICVIARGEAVVNGGNYGVRQDRLRTLKLGTTMDRIAVLHFLPIYLLLVVSLCLCLCLFLSAKREIRRIQLRLRQQNMQLQEAYDRMEFSVEQLKKRVPFREGRTPEGTPAEPRPVVAESGITLSKRTQAARMFRKGERPEQIAAALDLQQNEVALLWEVHQSSRAAYS